VLTIIFANKEVVANLQANKRHKKEDKIWMILIKETMKKYTLKKLELEKELIFLM
jgi:hypothetical protein